MIDPMSIDLFRFFVDWTGPPDANPSPLGASHRWLPEPLKQWFELTSQWSEPFMRLKRMRRPEEIEAEDGKAIFMEDPTGDWLWAFDTDKTNVVYEAELGGRWDRATEFLPELLVHNALSEATYNARAWREYDNVEERFVTDILTPLDEVALGEWRWPSPGHRVFMGTALVAEVSPTMDLCTWETKPGYADLRIAASDVERLSYLDRIASIRWSKSR
ncbi:hypothetical protein HII36_00005 [Nonomuraea sp. NN258]|uniref:hypothetical protein n=1 Tax=Nonomuraea antri TaxID=2730852 RepID=UPI001569C6CD|nr:hypothetical protein [Nonomuraea antri]NRQ30227.1 hypothetical protein [Nonomuraea antri]